MEAVTIDKSLHTKGKLRVSPAAIHRNGYGTAWVKTIVIDQAEKSTILAQVLGMTTQETEANAAHIVTCVNAHDELVSIAKQCLFLFSNEANYPEGTTGYRIAQKSKEALKKATT